MEESTMPKIRKKKRSTYKRKRPLKNGISMLLADWLKRGDFAAEIDACERTVARMQKQGLPYTVIAGQHYIHKTRGIAWVIERGAAA